MTPVAVTVTRHAKKRRPGLLITTGLPALALWILILFAVRHFV